MFRLLVAALATPLLAFASPVNLQKRTSGRATYYQVGLGACGQYNVPSDFIVALNAAQFEIGGYPSPQCGRGITIHYGGRSAHATVMDECPYGGCNYGDLDLSQGLFEYFAPTSAGVFYMEWEFDGEGGAPPPQPQPQQPTTTETPPAPTTTSTPPASATSSSSSSSSSSTPDGAVFSDQAAPSDTPTDNSGQYQGDPMAAAGAAIAQLANVLLAAKQY